MGTAEKPPSKGFVSFRRRFYKLWRGEIVLFKNIRDDLDAYKTRDPAARSPCAMVNHQTSSNLCTWMYLNPSKKLCQLGNQSGNKMRNGKKVCSDLDQVHIPDPVAQELCKMSICPRSLPDKWCSHHL